ncbi:DUF1573 domain-containing protein [Rubripirellula reticaptiva]|uniref:DUF1573 domain-containing protein n=1 Tax=Rubripirellula reticaptiva TaxID=2528013 RepID=A0A5C6EDN1_9BACT|nr:DUF1573 domain-containing protein [Rubripirellula reticaptiva]TWU47142.1 hypothetical protein Poly59_61170 [Rubripirellula reticaptiva]
MKVASVLVAILLATPVCSEETIKLSVAERDELPMLGEVSITEFPAPPPVLEAADSFVDETITTRVRVNNQLGHSITIQTLKTTCGCTAAYPRDSIIASGESTELLVKIAISKPNEFGVQVVIKTDNGSYPFKIQGVSQTRVSAVQSILELDKDKTSVPFALRVNDRSINPKSLRLRVAGREADRTSIEGDVVSFTVATASLSAQVLNRFIPWVGKKELTPIEIKVVRKGFVRLATTNVFVSKGDPSSFRLLMIGDIPSVTDSELKGSLELASETLEFNAILSKRGRAAVADCTIVTERPFDGANGTMTLGDMQFMVNLRDR